VKLGHRAAGLFPTIKRQLSSRFIRQDGAVAVEMVLVSMLLVPLVCGLLDFGMLWQKHQTAEAAMRQSARRVASSCVVPLNDSASACKVGNKADDDTKALSAVLSALGSAADELETVVVFNANASSATDLNGSAPAGCLTATPPVGVADQCNVYGPSEMAAFATLTPAQLEAKFSCTTHQVRHRNITGLFGSTAPVKAQAIFRLEPNTLAPSEVHADDVDIIVVTSTSTTTEAPTSTSTTTTIQTAWWCWNDPVNPFNSQAAYDAGCPTPPTVTSTSTTTTIQTVWWCSYTGAPYYSQAAHDSACIPPVIPPTSTTTRLHTGSGNT
jgi:Flp pilus assembly protein TadG